MAIFHLHISHGTRAKGKSALKSFLELHRLKAGSDVPSLIAYESLNLPSWAASPLEFWMSADKWSRANGRLYTEIGVAVPLELSATQQIDCIQSFVKALVTREDGRIPCTWALHDANVDNPYAKIMLASRIDDEVIRSDARTWWSRAAPVGSGQSAAHKPERCGARSWSFEMDRKWVLSTRAAWSAVANSALLHAGHSQRIDHRSYAEQDSERDAALRRIATKHEGPDYSPGIEGRREFNKLVRSRSEAQRRLQDLLE